MKKFFIRSIFGMPVLALVISVSSCSWIKMPSISMPSLPFISSKKPAKTQTQTAQDQTPPDRTQTRPDQAQLQAKAPPEGAQVQTASPSTAAADRSLITFEAGGSNLKPSQVRVEAPGSYILQVNNLTGSELSLRLKDPADRVIKTLNVGPKATSISNIELTAPGSYELAGDKFLLLFAGKKARITVGPGK